MSWWCIWYRNISSFSSGTAGIVHRPRVTLRWPNEVGPSDLELLSVRYYLRAIVRFATYCIVSITLAVVVVGLTVGWFPAALLTAVLVVLLLTKLWPAGLIGAAVAAFLHPALSGAVIVGLTCVVVIRVGQATVFGPSRPTGPRPRVPFQSRLIRPYASYLVHVGDRALRRFHPDRALALYGRSSSAQTVSHRR